MNLLKRLLYTFLMMAIIMSCKDDDPQPSVENAKFSLGASSPLELPSNLTASQDEHAQQVVAWAAAANAMSNYSAMFTPPQGAEKSTTAITPANGRLAATTASVVVYTWSDPYYGSVAYQVSDLSDRFTFEIFTKEDGSEDWYRLVYAEEQKDGSEGYLVVYDITDNSGDVWMRWDWTRNGSTFIMDFSSMGVVSYTFTIDTNTNAGSIVYSVDNEIIYELTWTSSGTGTWKEYSDGELVASGEW